jgi:hypothetical protein
MNPKKLSIFADFVLFFRRFSPINIFTHNSGTQKTSLEGLRVAFRKRTMSYHTPHHEKLPEDFFLALACMLKVNLWLTFLFF